MPLYQVNLRLAVNETAYAFKWSNTFYVDVANALAAAYQGHAIWDNAWRTVHASIAFCYETYATSATEGDADYAIVAHPVAANMFGGQAISGDLMPPWNVARLDMNVVGSRPSRKFIRAPWSEGNIQFDNLTGSAATAVGAVGGLLAALGTPIRDESGGTVTSYSPTGATSRRLGKWAYTGVPSKPILP